MNTADAGWYDDGQGRQRWWDGTQWTEHYAPQHTPAATVALAPQSAADIRRTRLNEVVADRVRYGWRVESQGDGYAVLVIGNKPNHILHLIITLFTFAIWAIVWIIVAANSGEKRQTIRVDDYGNVTIT